MPDGVEEALSFDISGALQGIGSISDALDQVVQTFQVGLADALSTLTNVGADVTPLADSLDVAGLGPAVDTAIADATSNPFGLTLDADATPVTDAIDQATSTPQTVSVEADTSGAEVAIQSLDSQDVTVGVDADTSDAQSQLDALGQSATGAAGDGTSGLFGVESAASGVGVATGLAEGNVSGLTGAFGALGPEAAATAGAIAGFVGFLGKAVTLAADAETQQNQFNQTFGKSAEIVDNIDVGGLTISMEDLGKTSGTTIADLETSATRIGQLGIGAGASQPQVAALTSDLLALGGTLAVTHPRLGDTSNAVDTLSRAFATGRTRSLQPYGIAISQLQIQKEAFDQSGKTSADQLTAYDKLLAGTTILLQQQGDTLGTKYKDGAAQAEVQFKALKIQLEETLVTVGKPLLGPAVDTLKAATPAAQQFAIALGQVGQADIPILQGLASALTTVANAMHLVTDAEKFVTVNGTGAAIAFKSLAETVGGPAVTSFEAVGKVLGFFHHSAKDTSDDLVGLTDKIQLLSSADPSAGLKLLGPALDDLSGHFKAGSKEATAFNNSLINILTTQGPAAAAAAVKVLTAALEKQGKTPAEITAVLGPYNEALKLAAATNAAAAIAIQQAGVTATASAGGFLQLADAIGQGKITADDAAGVAAQLGISTADATTFINDQTAALTDQKDKQIESTDAAQRLRTELQLGTITTSEAETQFANLGISIGGITPFISEAEAAVKQFVDSTVQKLPTVADAFKDATTKSGVNLDSFERQLQQKILNISGFVSNLSTLVGEGFGNLASFLAAQGPQVAGEAAAALATDANRAKILDSTIGLFGGADFAAAIKLRKLFPGLSEAAIQQATGGFAGAGAAAGSAFQQGLTQGLNAPGTAGANQTSAGRARLFGPATAQAATDGKAAGAAAGGAAQEGFDGAFHPAAAAQQKLAGVSDAISSGGQAAARVAASAGTSISGAFAKQLTFETAVSGAIHRTPAAFINAAGQVESIASGAGNELGVSFGAGIVTGISSETPFIAQAATKAAAAAVKAAKDQIKPGSPSKVTTLLGQQFSEGLALGIVDATPQAVDASTVLANSVVKQLQDALAAATSGSGSAVQTAAQSAFTSFLSTAGSALPSLGSDISSFAQTIISTTQAQDQAFKEYKKALAGQADDQQKVQDLQQKTGIAYGVLTVAMQHYNALAASEPKKASDAQKKALQAAKDALSAAQSQFDSFSNKLDSANSRLKDAAKNLHQVELAFQAATTAQDKANDPSTFTQGLRAQNAQANQFAKDIAKLAREGFTDLAKQLADAGPEAAAGLARGFASSKSKAKAAEAAVDAANTFATNFQAELTRLFGPSGGAVDAAHTAGTSIGQALTTGLQVSSQAGTAAALAGISSQIAAGIPQVIPLVAAPQVQKALTPVAANAPTIIQTPTLAGQNVSQSLELDLTIVLDDGRTVTAQTSVPFTPAPTRSLKQLVRAQVHAS